ncbi:MAG TPA: hypothetical protein VJN21_10325 [Candidatus Acidoferrales bacterium]|nr:hypothetical protein [Candidatus Acidoferrales bacterium]
MISRVGHCGSILSALLLTLASAIGLRANTLAPLSLEQITSAAAVIVHARCSDTESRWRDGEIWTITSFRTEEIWKGAIPHHFQIWMIGGRIGQLTSYVPGAPQFVPGEEVVLFLELTRSGSLSITAWGEGTFRIHREATTGEVRVTQDSAAWPMFDANARSSREDGIYDWPLEKLKSRVLAAEASETNRRRKQ